MYSDGCAGAVKRILGKMEGKIDLQGSFSHTHSNFAFIVNLGVSDVATNVESKTVVVTHSSAVTKEEMLAKLQKVRS